MTILTHAAALALILQQHCVPPKAADVIVGIAEHEGGGTIDTFAIHDNLPKPLGKTYRSNTIQQAITTVRSLIAIGHVSLDVGAGMVNTQNWSWTGLTLETAFDACANFRASKDALFVRYNGLVPGINKADNPRKVAYANGVTARIADGDTTPPQPQQPPCPDPDDTGWHITARNPGCQPNDPDWHKTPPIEKASQ